MKRTLLVAIVLIILAAIVLITIQKPQIQPSPSVAANSPAALGKSGSLELTINIGKNSFASGEIISALLTLKNTGDKEVLIEYFPSMPFNIFLYDKNGDLAETFMGERAASLIRTDILSLKAGESFSRTLNFSVEHPQGMYQIAGAFVGGVMLEPSQTADARSMEGKALVRTERISITIT